MKTIIRNIFYRIHTYIIIALVAMPLVTHAGSYGLDETAKKAFGDTITNKADLPTQLGEVINGVLGLIGIIFLILAIYGGFRILLSSGNPESVKKGRDVLIYAIIGMIVIVLAYSITKFVFTQIIGTTI